MRLFFSLILCFFLAGFAPTIYASDTVGPEVSAVAPLSATYTISQLFYATASDSSGVASCTLLVSSLYETPMTYNSVLGRWEATYIFTTKRSANSIRAVCLDELDNMAYGPSKIIAVADAPINDTDSTSSEVDATAWSRDSVVSASPVLIKTVCPGGEDFTHPCRTVYFLDNDGVRHTFPNEKAYFTWYADFSNIHLLTNDTMASFALGKNVTYHPGTKMVKFPSLTRVYAVARHGVLRPIASEDVAVSLYGAGWNKKIDDVSEAFYTNYTFGAEVTHADDFSVEFESGSVSSINDNL
jgi:hypothetical protein